jgi:hypothetical protein
LLDIVGNLSVTTTGGQSTNDVYDYNVHGSVTINAGPGISSAKNSVGIEDNQTVAGSGIPVIGGSVTIKGGAVTNANPGLSVNLGINGSTDLPLVIAGGLTISVTGSGAANIDLNDLAVTGTTSVTLGSFTSGNTFTEKWDTINAQSGPLTINGLSLGNNNYTVENTVGTTAFTGAVTFKLGAGNDTLTVGTDTGILTAGGLSISGTGGGKTITVEDADFTSVTMSLLGFGSETTTFTDVNVSGASTVTHSGGGTTSFTIDTSTSNNTNKLNTWGSLTITNGSGNDTTTISDTDFTGGVTIANLGGGSTTTMSASNNTGLLDINGNLSITTTGGQSSTDVFDYNVFGNVTINTGPGVSGTQNTVGLEDNQTTAGSGIPVIGGSVTIKGTAVTNANPGLTINLGTDGGSNNFPLVIGSNLSVSAIGSGSASIDLNDLTVANGNTTISLGQLTNGNTVSVQADSNSTAVFDNFSILSLASGSNTYNLQDQAGTLMLTGTVKVLLGSGDDTVNVAADSSNPTGVTGAIVELFGPSLWNGDGGINSLFTGTTNTNVFFIFTPVTIDF